MFQLLLCPGGSQLFGVEMLVVPLRGKKLRICYCLGCQRWKLTFEYSAVPFRASAVSYKQRHKIVSLNWFKCCQHVCFWLVPLSPGGYSHIVLGGGVPLGSWKSYPLLDQILQILWPYTRPKMLNCSWFQSFGVIPLTLGWLSYLQ